MADPRFVAAVNRRKCRAMRARERRDEIPQQYSSWRAALPAACAAMYRLNRYAKHPRCSAPDKFEIYRLKNGLIRWLYESGYCRLAWIHRLELPEQQCRECCGDGGFCGHCDGSGIWREARQVEFWCFKFVLREQTYCWYQPRESLSFEPTECLPPQDWSGLVRTEPKAMRKESIALAEELIDWVIGSAVIQASEPPCLPETSGFELCSE
jgi:hypothetical protein